LRISTEVSALSNQGSFGISNGPGNPSLVIPGLTVRRAETTVELPSGGALMLAGLLQDTSSQDLSSVTWLGDIPVLGALLRSRDYQSGQNRTGGDRHPIHRQAGQSRRICRRRPTASEIANDKDTILLGKLNKSFNRPPEATTGRTYQAPIGYVVE